MFQFPGFASHAYVFSIRYRIRGGFPHSEIFGSKFVRNSPKLIAAYHVFHRLPAPRHPLNALKTLDLSSLMYGGRPARTALWLRTVRDLATCPAAHERVRQNYYFFRIRPISLEIGDVLAFESRQNQNNRTNPLSRCQSRIDPEPGGSGPYGVRNFIAPCDALRSLWWSQTGSNRRPPACKAGALPTELWPLEECRSPLACHEAA